ncbi:hypothetical protein [Mesorhizobium opportunistum]|uniref:Uncharacterized protein n=1 Tax=Mesorhizobium opportunistum (strain LMG 24607 / HAMBI 3007 / WSM2075) TaxID=536019 RepID=F7YCJ6_MESOW|nr:hypothetical protein [Mesorhizobium opportunistum]AEH87808.1 hypothetical protein Mesop_3360 [Mesorhizobium opportunistum WSM2075]
MRIAKHCSMSHFPPQRGQVCVDSMSNWDALTIQMVWFSGDARRSNAGQLFTAFTGAEPDSYQSNKAPGAPVPILSAAAGTVDGVSFNISVQTSRVDLVVQGRAEDTSDQPTLIESPEGIISGIFLPRAHLIGSQLSSINRLALVTTLCKPADTHVQANEIVAELIGMQLPRYDVTDFAFQVNARVPLDGPSGIAVNRFLKFGVMSFHTVTLDLGGQIVSPQEAQVYNASLAIDVNIVPHFQPIQADLQSDIWEKLASETLRIRNIGKLDGLW